MSADAGVSAVSRWPLFADLAWQYRWAVDAAHADRSTLQGGAGLLLVAGRFAICPLLRVEYEPAGGDAEPGTTFAIGRLLRAEDSAPTAILFAALTTTRIPSQAAFFDLGGTAISGRTFFQFYLRWGIREGSLFRGESFAIANELSRRDWLRAVVGFRL